MFLDFYNFREQPFGVTPDPKYLYLSSTHREALASLVYGVQSSRGFMTLIAKPGMGKTTLLFCLLERLQGFAKTAFLFHTQCNSEELLRHMLRDLGCDKVFKDAVEMRDHLNGFLLHEAQSGRQVVVIVDEAQNLSEEVLESVRLLSNFETSCSKLIQVILAGQPPLADKLASPSLAQLRQRLSIMARLEPFTLADTSSYIDHRLRVSGYSGNGLFDPEARSAIATLSEGIPRNVNNICFNALSLGFALQRTTIDASIVREAAADLDIASLRSELKVKSPSQTIRQIGMPVSSSDLEPGGAVPQAMRGARQTFPTATTVRRRSKPKRWALRDVSLFALFIMLSMIPIQASEMEDLPPLPPNTPLASTIMLPIVMTGSRVPSTTTVVVKDHQTIAGLSKEYVGRFDGEVYDEIRQLNPQLGDLIHLKVGERITLPRYLMRQTEIYQTEETHEEIVPMPELQKGGQ